MCLKKQGSLRLAGKLKTIWRKFTKTFRERAGCVVLKRTEEGLMVLLIEAAYKKKEIWKIAAGGIEKGETAQVAAQRETYEESGAVGEAIKFLHQTTDYTRMTHTVFYLMGEHKLLDISEYEEGIKGRRRKWMLAKDALSVVPEDQTTALKLAIESFEKSQ